MSWSNNISQWTIILSFNLCLRMNILQKVFKDTDIYVLYIYERIQLLFWFIFSAYVFVFEIIFVQLVEIFLIQLISKS